MLQHRHNSVDDETDGVLQYECRPGVVVEVVSDSTEATDRREKLQVYRAMPSVSLYLISPRIVSR